MKEEKCCNKKTIRGVDEKKLITNRLNRINRYGSVGNYNNYKSNKVSRNENNKALICYKIDFLNSLQ